MLFSLYLRYGLKTGIACVLAYTVSFIVGAPYAIWAVVSTVVAMQMNVADSLQVGILRFGGTVLGAALGVGLLLTVPLTPAAMGVAVFCVASACAYLTRFTSLAAPVSIAAMVVLLTGTQHLPAGYWDAASFGLMRVMEIAIGVGSAFLVSLLLWPVRLVDTLRADLSLQFQESARLMDSLLIAFLDRQQTLPYAVIQSIEGKIWNNHERLSKARKHESFLYRYEHRVMDVQISALDRTVESLRFMLEALNDYGEEEGRDPLTGAELRTLGDAIMAALRYLGGDDPTAPAPDLVRGLTGGVALVEAKLAELRTIGATKAFPLHKVLQFFSFYQAMRVLSESLLISLDRLQKQPNKSHG